MKIKEHMQKKTLTNGINPLNIATKWNLAKTNKHPKERGP